MKKLLLCIVMLFSIAINSTELSDKLRGAWSSDKTSYYVVILHDEKKGYEFINFSFAENKSLPETVVEEGENYIKTKLINKEKNYEVFIKYSFVDGKLHCQFEGDSNHTTVYKRHWILTN